MEAGITSNCLDIDYGSAWLTIIVFVFLRGKLPLDVSKKLFCYWRFRIEELAIFLIIFALPEVRLLCF